MKQLCIGLALAAGMTTTALAAADPLTAPIHQFIDAFDKGDTKTAAGAYAVGGVTIIDEVPPHLWQGPKGFESWAADLMKDAKAHGDTNAGVTLGNVARQEVTGSRAYVVFPAVYSFTEKGVALREAGHMTFVLARGKAGWKIAAWTWTGPTRATRAGK